MFIIYNVNTTITIKGTAQLAKSFRSEAAAKGYITRKGLDKNEWAVAAEVDFMQNIEKQVERTNIMTGKKFVEPINTPTYASPAYEAYFQF